MLAMITSKGPFPASDEASPSDTAISSTWFNSMFSSELRTHHSSISMAVQGTAPRMRARMARMEVPQPISRRDLPCRSLSSSSPMMRLVVSWCPVPKAICGLMTISYSVWGTSWWKVLWMTQRSPITIGWKKFFSHSSFQSLSSASVKVYSIWVSGRGNSSIAAFTVVSSYKSFCI